MSKKEKQEVSDDKDKSLALAIAALEKQYGTGVVVSGDTDWNPIARIPSGSIELDRALGGGYAQGRIIELLGMESAGKTTAALHAIAEAQNIGMKCAFIDVEHALDIHYAAAIGVDTVKLLIAQPSSGEEALNIVEMLVKSNAVGLIVIDSVAALVPRAELEKDIGDSSVGRQALLMSQAMRMLAGPASKCNTTLLFLNQYRQKIVLFGDPNIPAGGASLKYYASQRLDMRRVETIELKEEKIGIRTKVKVLKNKVGAPYKEVQFNILFGQGIDKFDELLNLCLEAGIIEKGGAWFSYGTVKIGQGTSNAAEFLRANPDVVEELRGKLLGKSNED